MSESDCKPKARPLGMAVFVFRIFSEVSESTAVGEKEAGSIFWHLWMGIGTGNAKDPPWIQFGVCSKEFSVLSQDGATIIDLAL